MTESNNKAKPLLVGELNPYGSEPEFALYPLPERATGDRLCRLIMKLRRGQYLDRFDRVNLCTGKWSVRRAREEVRRLVRTQPSCIVLLGAKVCTAFGVKFEPFTKQDYGEPFLDFSVSLVILPHPSGLCRLWSVPGAFGRARDVLVDAGVLEHEAVR